MRFFIRSLMFASVLLVVACGGKNSDTDRPKADAPASPSGYKARLDGMAGSKTQYFFEDGV